MSKFVLVCPNCKNDDLQIWDGGGEHVYFCKNCCEEDECIPVSNIYRKHNITEWTKPVE